MSGQHENAGTDNVADAERHQGESRKTALERHAVVRGQLLDFGRFGFGLQAGNRFADKIIGHRDARGEPTTTTERALSFTGTVRNSGLIPATAVLRACLTTSKKDGWTHRLLRRRLLHIGPELLRGLVDVAEIDHVIDLHRAVDLLGIDEEL